MSYYDNRGHREPYGHERGYDTGYEDEYDKDPIHRDYATQRDYGSRQSRRPRHEFRRRASSVGDEPSYYADSRSQPDRSRAHDRYSQRPKYDSSSESESEPSSRHTNRRKSTGGRHRNESRSRDYSSDRVHDNGNSHHDWADTLRNKGGEILMQAALPLIAAGAAEALRSRKTPGEWKGDKGKRVVKAAVTDGLIKRDPNKSHAHHIVDTTVSGLKEGHPTHEEMAEIQRRAGGNRSLSNFKKVAAASALAFAGIELYDRYGHSRSRNDSEGYKDASSGLKKRSQSVSDDRNRREGSFDPEERSYRTYRGHSRDDRSDPREPYRGRDRGYRAQRYSSESDED